MTTPEQMQKYQRTADRWNQRQADKNPLFAQAGILEQVAELRSAEYYATSHARYIDQLDNADRKLDQRAEYYRTRIRKVSYDLLYLADEAWKNRTGPTSPEYKADHYGQIWRELKEDMQQVAHNTTGKEETS